MCYFVETCGYVVEASDIRGLRVESLHHSVRESFLERRELRGVADLKQ